MKNDVALPGSPPRGVSCRSPYRSGTTGVTSVVQPARETTASMQSVMVTVVSRAARHAPSREASPSASADQAAESSQTPPATGAAESAGAGATPRAVAAAEANIAIDGFTMFLRRGPGVPKEGRERR